MVQGDKYSLGVEIKTKNGTLITDQNIEKVRIKLGNVEDGYPEGTVVYSSDDGKWKLPLTQEQTFAMDHVRLQVRIIFENGDIFNSEPQVVTVREAIIKEVENSDENNGDS